MPDYLRPEDVPLDEPQDDDTLLWLTNRNRHDLVQQYHSNMSQRSATEPVNEEGEGEQPKPYDQWNVEELKAELRSRLGELTDEDEEARYRLTVASGDRKPDLIRRLEDDDAALAEQEPEDDGSDD